MREWFSQPEHMLLALLVSLLLIGIARLPHFLAWLGAVSDRIAAFGQPWPSRRLASVPQVTAPLALAPAQAPPAVVAGAGTALQNPPGILHSITYMRRVSPNDRYLLPLGWWRNSLGQADLVHTALVGETNHMLISGASDCGKDNLAWWMLLSLALVHTDPDQFQIAILDGKGLDFQAWAVKQHTFLLATESEQIPAAMRRLTAERRRRRQILEHAEVSKWDNYQGSDLPLLVVFISELSLLEGAVRRERQRRGRDKALELDLESWLNDELTSGRAFGIRYLIGMQTVTGMDMLWRSQIGVFQAGYQPDETQVKPNTSKTARQLLEGGSIPPNQIPPPPTGAGVFTVVSGNDCTTVSAPYLSDSERRNWLARLPDKVPDADAVLARLFEQIPALATGDLERAVETEPFAALQAGTQKFAGVQPDFSAAESSFAVFEGSFSAADIAEIGARIARGEKKTEVVRGMRGYDTRRHREFAAFYDMVFRELSERGILGEVDRRKA